MSKDRLQFNKTILSNGLTLWAHPLDVPFAQIRILIPVGNAHAHLKNEGGAHGIAHFLEHMCLERSLLFPEKDSFENKIAQNGGDWNASTNPYYTDFYMQLPTEAFNALVPGFLSQIFNPLFNAEDINIQKNIIQNERELQKYYPGHDELTFYKFTSWMRAHYYSKFQLYGSDDSLNAITPTQLETFHQNYHSKHTQIILGGSFDESAIMPVCERIETKEITLVSAIEAAGWVNREYHVAHSKDIESPLYSWGNLIPESSLSLFWSISFICEYLTDQNVGILIQWIRKEKGWSYTINSNAWFDSDRIGWTIDIPTNTEENISEIRNELHARVCNALNDVTLVQGAIERTLRQNVFFFQTLSDRMNLASEYLMCFGNIPTEAEYRHWVKNEITPPNLMRIYDRYFAKDITGELLALPAVQDTKGVALQG